MNTKRMNKSLDFLRGKYGAGKGEITLIDGHCFVGATPLLPGRMERKIVELKKMTENGTLEGVSTLRFASFAPKGRTPRRLTISQNRRKRPRRERAAEHPPPCDILLGMGHHTAELVNVANVKMLPKPNTSSQLDAVNIEGDNLK